MKIQIIVATHKEYRMPSDSMYLPVFVGSAGKPEKAGRLQKLGYARDDSGDHISEKNKNYCELTGLYWAWKNVHADYIGLVHYRRLFSGKGKGSSKNDKAISRAEMEVCLQKADVLLPKPRHYWIDTNYGQYAHAHHAIDLDTTREIISERCPEYLKAWDQVMKKTSGHRFNMMVMKRDLLDAYCEWLFDLLFELEKRLDISTYNANDARVFGFVSERLLDVWLQTKQIKFLELPYVFMEKQNWLVKGSRFIQRRLGGKQKK